MNENEFREWVKAEETICMMCHYYNEDVCVNCPVRKTGTTVHRRMEHPEFFEEMLRIRNALDTMRYTVQHRAGRDFSDRPMHRFSTPEGDEDLLFVMRGFKSIADRIQEYLFGTGLPGEPDRDER